MSVHEDQFREPEAPSPTTRNPLICELPKLKDHANIRRWIDDFEIATSECSEQRRLQFLKPAIEDEEVRRWFLSRSEILGGQSWTAIKESLLHRFASVYDGYYEAELRRCEYKPGGPYKTVSAYLEKIYELVLQLYKSESRSERTKAVYMYAKGGLDRTTLINLMACRSHGEQDTLESLFKAGECYDHKHGPLKKASSSMTEVQLEEVLTKLLNKRKTVKLEKAAVGKPAKGYAAPIPSTLPRTGDTPPNPCRYCGGPHWNRDCTQKPQAQDLGK